MQARNIFFAQERTRRHQRMGMPTIWSEEYPIGSQGTRVVTPRQINRHNVFNEQRNINSAIEKERIFLTAEEKIKQLCNEFIEKVGQREIVWKATAIRLGRDRLLNIRDQIFGNEIKVTQYDSHMYWDEIRSIMREFSIEMIRENNEGQNEKGICYIVIYEDASPYITIEFGENKLLIEVKGMSRIITQLIKYLTTKLKEINDGIGNKNNKK